MSSKKQGNTAVSSGVTSEAVLQFYESLDCARSLAAAILYRYGEGDQLVSLTCDPLHYCSSSDFRDAYLATNFLSKSTFVKTSFDREGLALEKFFKFEERCADTNQRFACMLSRGNSLSSEAREARDKQHSEFASLLNATIRKISLVLGDYDAQELFDVSSWGPGVSTLIKGEETFAAKKFQFETGITRELYPLAVDVLPTAYPGWVFENRFLSKPSIQEGNTIVTVPKTSKIDRVIAIEPGLNLWFQLGIGRMIRRRLGYCGIDLTDQGRNQRLAKVASVTGDLTTVDFSSASDSIAKNLVEVLLPPDWVNVMEASRCQYGVIGTQRIKWQKFSSMGNGFTFDLESLIFYSAACAVCKQCGYSSREVSVYGDDVILPTSAYTLYASFCDYLGFSVNPEKSFSTGCFRESCGSHYYAGVDCKPVYLKDRLATIQEVYVLANNVRLRGHVLYGCDKRFKRLFYYLKSSVDKVYRCTISAIESRDGLEAPQGGFVSNLDETRFTRPDSSFYEGYVVRRVSWTAVKLGVSYPGLLLSRLADIACREFVDLTNLTSRQLLFHSVREARRTITVVKSEGNLLPLRGRTRFRLKPVTFRQWYDLGPWI